MNNKFKLNWNLTESRGLLLGGILITALIGFEIFNYDTTRYALLNLVGGLQFVGLEWGGILAFAFCGIDFAGLIRLFTPEQGMDEPKEIWLLTGAWLIGATMNAMMTWYAVSVAIAGRQVGTTLVTTADMLTYAPIFVAVLVWLTRILFIGSISVAADKMLHQPARTRSRPRSSPRRAPLRANGRYATHRTQAGQDNFREEFFNNE